MIFTARKRSLRRLCFYRGRVLGQVPPMGRYTPGRYIPLGRYTPGQVHPLPPPSRYPPWAGTPLLGRYTPRAGSPLGRYTPQAGTPPGKYPPNSACWDTVNKRVVCIPPECILVIFMLTMGTFKCLPKYFLYANEVAGR